MSKEKEIDLNKSFTSDVTGKEIEGSNTFRPRKSSSMAIPSNISELSDDELINAIVSAPDDMFMPWEEVTLPSLGLYYDGWKNGVVRVRPMIQSVEKLFTDERKARSGAAMESMYKYCVESPGDTDPLELLIGDRTFLMYVIRGITYGNLYKFATKCPACDADSTHTYDMNELYETVTPADPNMGKEPFPLVLPHISKLFNREISVGMRFLRGFDIQESRNKQRFNKRLTNSSVRTKNKRGQSEGGDSDLTESILDDSILRSVVHVNGNTEPLVISEFIGKLSAADHSVIKTFLKDKTPSMDTSVEIECPVCGNVAMVSLPITAGFFQSAE
jgi:hypothetical protein